jgi:hypothetical protein
MAPNSSIMHNDSGFFIRWLMIAAPDLNLPGPINAAAFTAEGRGAKSVAMGAKSVAIGLMVDDDLGGWMISGYRAGEAC